MCSVVVSQDSKMPVRVGPGLADLVRTVIGEVRRGHGQDVQYVELVQIRISTLCFKH